VTWDSYASQDAVISSVRKEFKGSIAINPVTDQPDIHFTLK
jgi:hypothetical protein